MIRKTLTILSLLGLLLSVGLWGASYYGVSYKRQSKTDGIELFAVHGSLWLLMWTGEDFEWTSLPRGWTFGDAPDGTRRHIFVPYYRGSFKVNMAQVSALMLPLYVPGLVLAILPLLAVRLFHRRRKRKRVGLCLKCGYDLRASKERCPECGHGFKIP